MEKHQTMEHLHPEAALYAAHAETLLANAKASSEPCQADQE
jgi:hypothetical protein